MGFPTVSRQRDITTKVETAVAAGHRPRKEKLLPINQIGQGSWTLARALTTEQGSRA